MSPETERFMVPRERNGARHVTPDLDVNTLPPDAQILSLIHEVEEMDRRLASERSQTAPAPKEKPTSLVNSEYTSRLVGDVAIGMSGDAPLFRPKK